MRRYIPNTLPPPSPEVAPDNSPAGIVDRVRRASHKTDADVMSNRMRGLAGPWRIALLNQKLRITCISCGFFVDIDKKGMAHPISDLTPHLAHECSGEIK